MSLDCAIWIVLLTEIARVAMFFPRFPHCPKAGLTLDGKVNLKIQARDCLSHRTQAVLELRPYLRPINTQVSRHIYCRFTH